MSNSGHRDPVGASYAYGSWDLPVTQIFDHNICILGWLQWELFALVPFFFIFFYFEDFCENASSSVVARYWYPVGSREICDVMTWRASHYLNTLFLFHLFLDNLILCIIARCRWVFSVVSSFVVDLVVDDWLSSVVLCFFKSGSSVFCAFSGCLPVCFLWSWSGVILSMEFLQ